METTLRREGHRRVYFHEPPRQIQERFGFFKYKLWRIVLRGRGEKIRRTLKVAQGEILKALRGTFKLKLREVASFFSFPQRAF